VNDKHFNQFLGLGRRILPILIKPLPDELLSSWIMRYSKELGIKSYTFCCFLLKSENVWNRDIDFNASDNFILALAEKSFLPFEKVYDCTLRSYNSNLSVDFQRRWIIPLGIYHRTRKNAGQMYCPICLRNDKVPYFRKRWRLSLSVVCPKCKVQLIDRCPNCNQPISFHRLEVGFKNSILNKDICFCFNCHFDLRNSKPTHVNSFLLTFQNHLYSTLELGYNNFTQYSHLYFDVLYQLCKYFNSNQKKFREFDHELSKKSGFLFNTNTNIFDFDKMPLSDRLLILSKINWLFENWPERLIDISQKVRFYSSYLLKDYENPAYWFSKIVMDNFYVVHSLWRSSHFPSYFSSYSSFGDAVLRRKEKRN